jgi:hypothetical protein
MSSSRRYIYARSFFMLGVKMSNLAGRRHLQKKVERVTAAGQVGLSVSLEIVL